MLDLEGLTKRFGKVVAVDGVTLGIQEGEFFSLLGPSGCGKTTVLRMVAGFERPDKGGVFLKGERVTHLPPERRPIGMVFQNYALFPNMTVFENVAFPKRLRKMPEDIIRKQVGELLDLVHLSGLERRYPKELSGGQQQRVALARALAREPRILLLDEPLSALDAKIREELRGELKRLQRETGLTTLYVTHDQEEALAMSDRIAVMRGGRLEQVGTPREIYLSPKTAFVARFVGEGVLIPGEAQGGHFYRDRPWPVEVEGHGKGFLLLRPETLKVGEGGFLHGRVVLSTYRGSWVRLEVEAEGLTLKIDHPLEGVPQVGQEVTVHLPPKAPFVPEEEQV